MPEIKIDLAKIEHNAHLVAKLLKSFGIRLVGVTKGVVGDGQVAGAMLAGGASALADSRPDNLKRLRGAHPGIELQLMRPPTDKLPDPDLADLYFVSSAAQAAAILQASPEKTVRFCLMVETGDGREGVAADGAAKEAVGLVALNGAGLAGVATTFGCTRPAAEPISAISLLKEIASIIGDTDGVDWAAPTTGGSPVVSVGGSGALRAFIEFEASPESGGAGPAVTDLRCGEAILLGRIPSESFPELLVPGCYTDAFLIDAPVQEVSVKNGRLQALVGLGIQDTGLAPLLPRTDGIMPLKVTSDYLAVSCESEVRAGDTVSFIPTYYSLQTAMSSPFVDKVFLPS